LRTESEYPHTCAQILHFRLQAISAFTPAGNFCLYACGQFLPIGQVKKFARRPGGIFCLKGAGVQNMSFYGVQEVHLFRVQKVHVIQLTT
jgi:hypothetical protein